MKKRPVITIDDDEWVTISWKGQHEQCCNCAMVHKVDYRVHEGKLQFKARSFSMRKLRK